MAERDAPQEASAGLAASADSIVASPDPGEIGALDWEQLPQVLRLLIQELTAVPPTIDTVDLGAASHGDDYFVGPSQAARSTNLDSVQMWVLGLIASCLSLKVVDLTGCRITKESQVQRLCEGLKRNTVLRRLVLDGNEGFGSDFGCRQVSLILVSTTSLEELCMDSVGMQVTGLSHLVAALVGNPAGSRLQVLDLENNQELGDESSGELLAQLLSNPSTSKCLKVLRIRGIPLTVAGAAPLSAALLARNTALEKFQVGPGRCQAEEEGGPLKTILSSVRCSTELKIQERQMQGALTREVDDVMSFVRDLQNTQMPRFPYFTNTDVGKHQRFVAFFRIGSALKLHFMCESRSGMHIVENQKGCDVCIVQIGAGVGGIVPDFTSRAGEIPPITSQSMGTVLNDITLSDQCSASKQEDVTKILQGFLEGKPISSIFQLYRVEYLQPSVGGRSPRFAWVCERCMKTGVNSKNLKECS